jgi:hypothetical protein
VAGGGVRSRLAVAVADRDAIVPTAFATSSPKATVSGAGPAVGVAEQRIASGSVVSVT